MFYLTNQPPDPVGYVEKSYAAHWVGWLAGTLPPGLHRDVRRRLVSNLKHILVGLEMKAALLLPHHLKLHGRSVLFESYAQILNFEFGVGVFSVCEGFGAARWLVDNGSDGSAGERVYFNDWKAALVRHVAPRDPDRFGQDVETVKAVRDRLHQDKLGARADIDWHAFDTEKSFEPALAVLHALLQLNADRLPAATNLRPDSENPAGGLAGDAAEAGKDGPNAV